MKKTILPLPGLRLLLLLFFSLMIKASWGQCDFLPVLHTTGTEPVACTDVTVTSQGFVFQATSGCGYGPFWIGAGGTGSYTFDFSNTISGIRVCFDFLHNDGDGFEELSFEINGAFYSVTDPGVPDGCMTPAVISPSGTIQAPTGSLASWKDVIIMEPMDLLKIEDTWLENAPAGILVSLFICCSNCETDAGEINAGPLVLCTSDLASVPSAQQVFLDIDDLLEYILFADQADSTGSIIATSSTPEFAFDPATMQPGVTYYIAAIAGNDLNGNVDPDDPCLDISNLIEVVWHTEPSVAFLATVTDVCVDNCYDIEINFTGTPPFHLVGEIVDADNNVVVIDETYNSNIATYNICLPENTPLGNLTIQAISLTDANCECN